jgi:hypothetical protein
MTAADFLVLTGRVAAAVSHWAHPSPGRQTRTARRGFRTYYAAPVRPGEVVARDSGAASAPPVKEVDQTAIADDRLLQGPLQRLVDPGNIFPLRLAGLNVTPSATRARG